MKVVREFHKQIYGKECSEHRKQPVYRPRTIKHVGGAGADRMRGQVVEEGPQR